MLLTGNLGRVYWEALNWVSRYLRGILSSSLVYKWSTLDIATKKGLCREH